MKQSEFDQVVQKAIRHRIKVADAEYREECLREQLRSIRESEPAGRSNRVLAANIRYTDAMAIRLQIEKGTR